MQYARRINHGSIDGDYLCCSDRNRDNRTGANCCTHVYNQERKGKSETFIYRFLAFLLGKPFPVANRDCYGRILWYDNLVGYHFIAFSSVGGRQNE